MADHRFMQATMTLIDEQAYASWKLPNNWHILLTTNPDNGDYNVTSLDHAQKTRFISVEIKFDVKVWARWAEKEGIDGRCINFLLMHPEIIENNKDINARSMTTFFNGISSIKNFSQQLPRIQMIGEGSVGGDVAQMFSIFINNKMDKIISPEDILTKDEAYVLGTLKSVIGEGSDFRADLSSIIANRVINYSLYLAEQGSIGQNIIDRLTKLITDCESFTMDLKYYMIKEIVNGNKVKFAKLMQNPDVVKMTIK